MNICDILKQNRQTTEMNILIFSFKNFFLNEGVTAYLKYVFVQ